MDQDPHMSEFDNLNDFSASNPFGEQFGLGDSSLSGHAKVPSLSIVEELEIRLGVGQVMKSTEDTYLLYCKYAHAKEFGVKKGDQRYFTGTKEIQAKEFECSCQGTKDEKCSNDRVPVYQKLITRTGCKTRLRVGREKGGEWKVTRFVLEHNHEMIAAGQTHLLRSSRNISHAQKLTMEALVNAKIPLASVLSYMEDKAQGSEHLGFIRKDAYDHFCHIKKCTKIENGDASELLQHFVNKSNDEPLFYWNMQVDDDNRTFLKSMGGKQPETIFTDQCQAMMNAIDTVFPCAHHRLCQWHINQNAPSHLGSMNNNSGFKKIWNECMHHCDSEEEFEVTWKKMIDDYNLDGHNWLKGMYNLRRRWSTTFSNNKFSASLLVTSRSEGTNSILKKAGNRTISLYSFVLNYEKVQKTWRANEKIEDTRCRHGKSTTILKNNPLLAHGANVYTLNIFNLFQVELFKSLNIQLREQPSHSGHFPRVFEMQSYGQNLKVRIVVFDVQKEEIRCSCHKFESMGILCRHALRVLNCMNVHIIPEMYIKKRWTKGMRNRLSNERSACVSSGSENASGCGNESEMVFDNQKMRFIYDLIMQCKAHEETRNMLTESFNSVAEKTITWLENLSIKDLIACNDLISSERNNQSTEEPLRNPLSIKSRGITNACIQRHWDESKKGKRKRKVETSKVIVKGTKRKGKNYQITTLECPSQEATTAPNTQEPVYVQPSHYPTGQPFQETLVENQPYWSQMGGNVPSTFPFLGPNFPQVCLA
ncbi:hypothetical protein BUALT_Bualt10G0072500 [Buddleja alternifolia]|uniref:SWIM-type domain-containing protein n=1 Tax=Buddleja alternifolia TaxID=168488 RepID=A0AAV6X1F2_9LAMI|nr:hypothetical protein BUALT_Bualt10G0072500 [Buddleja alternifolia]